MGCRTPPSCPESHLPGGLKRVYFTHWRAVLLAAGPERLRVENWNFRASGLIGNVLFADRYLVVIDLPRRRFGLVERHAP